MTPPRESPQQRLGARLRGALDDADMTHREFAIAVGNLVKNAPYSESIVTGWLGGVRTMSPEQLMAAEEILNLRPGTLTQEAGYLPVGSFPVADVPTAIERDPDLSAAGKRAVTQAYRDALEQTRRTRDAAAAKRKKHRR